MRDTATAMVFSGMAWRSWILVFLIAFAPSSVGGVRPSVMAGGSGSSPDPPTTLPNGPTLATPSGEYLRLPLVVAISGSLQSYSVVVTSPSAGVVATGTTDAQGLVVLYLPAGPGLELDVLGTSVIGLPVHAGQVVSIVIP